LTLVDEQVGLLIEIAELGITIRVLAPFGHLGVGLKRVAEPMQEAQHRTRGDLEILGHQLLGQLGRRLRRPTQPRHRVAPGLGVDEFVESFEQLGLGVEQGLVASTRGTLPVGRLDTALHFGLGLNHGVAAHTRRRRHRRLVATSEHLRHGAGDYPTLAFVEVLEDHLEESRKSAVGDPHMTRVLRAHYSGVNARATAPVGPSFARVTP
jgi:hypothetical protein